ncbi:MAG TPA: hypothetical protein VFD92_02570 [Candidatus Binatia bacterium]|nr:hypothetical protein [Candidatus Binatia bacterium]
MQPASRGGPFSGREDPAPGSEWEHPATVPPRFLAIFLLFFVLSFAIRAPAVVNPWWHQDDHLVRVQDLSTADGLAYYLRMGRPGSLVYHAAVKPAYEDERWAFAARVFAIALLAAVGAAVATSFMARGAPRWGAMSAGLYAVTWPFASEATVWLDGTVVVLACALSIGGVIAVLSSRRTLVALGVAAIVAAVLTHPAGATGGAALAAALAAAGMVIDGPRVRRAWTRAALIAAAYASGLGTAYALTRLWGDPSTLGNRGKLTPGLGNSLWYLGRLEGVVLFLYDCVPRAVVWTLVILPAIALFVVPGLGRGRRHLRRTGGALSLLVLASALSFLPSLVTAERWPSPRVAFAGTIGVAGWLATAQIVGRDTGILRMVSKGLLAAYLASAAWMAWQDASDYVRLYRRDSETLARIELAARASGTQDVYVARRPPFFSWNPYRLRFDLGRLDHQRSEFLVDWQTKWLLEATSRLRIGRDGRAGRACLDFEARRQPTAGFDVVPLPDGMGVCVIPAR